MSENILLTGALGDAVSRIVEELELAKADLRALRQFAQDVLEAPTDFTYAAGRNCGLLDAHGNPTRRLTGE